MKKVIILAALAFMGQNSWAQFRQFQTARLIATGGAGVASVLATEAAILNPATAAFFKGSSFSYQRLDTKLRSESPQRQLDSNPFAQKNRSEGFFLADHSGPVKGGTAYITQSENDYERTSYILHGAAPMGKKTAMGVSYSFLQDQRPPGSPDQKQTHHRASIGLAHIVDEKTLLGLTLVDPTRTTPGEERLTGGFQYSIADRFTVIGDIGTQYTKDVQKFHVWSAAVQMNVFSDFFLFLGRFHDDIFDQKGTGWGISWVGPRFGVNFAQRYSKQFSSTSDLYLGEEVVDTALSGFIKF